MRTKLVEICNGLRQIEYELHLDLKVIGKIWLNKDLDCDYECGISHVEIIEEFRGKGYGKELIQHIITIARKREHKVIFLRVKLDNQIAIRLYSRFGFEEAYRQDGKNGVILQMQLNLN